MEGGVAIILLIVIAVVALGIGITLYLTGGLIGSRGSESAEDEPRPDHKVVENPEKVHFVGTDRED
jgi:hypothetical protein